MPRSRAVARFGLPRSPGVTAISIALAVAAAAGIRAAEFSPSAEEASTAGPRGDSPAQRALRARLDASPYRILFEAYENDNWDIFSIRPDGSERRNLTRTPRVHELYPQASPDGTRIAFLQDVERDGGTLRSVAVMAADGSGRAVLAEKARQPCWSPDGSRIAWLPQEFGKFQVKDFVSKGLSIHDLASGRTTPHPNRAIHHLYCLSWAPGGNWFTATVHGGMGFSHAILAIEARGSRVFDLHLPGCRPSVSCDGRRVTWSRDDHTIGVADLDLNGAEPRASGIRVVHHHQRLHLYHPDFSPDGRFIVFSMGPGGRVPARGPGTHTEVAEMVGVRGKWDLYLKASDGTGPLLRLTFDEDLSNKEPEWSPATPAPAATRERAP